jgi:chorismate mutase
MDMKKKPFIWFRVNRHIDLRSLQEFNNDIAGNFGLALSHYGFIMNDPKSLREINSSLNIPIAFFVTDRDVLHNKMPGFIQKRIISLETRGLKFLEFKQNYLPCYRVHIPKKKGFDISKLLSDMSEYFLVRGLDPSREAILEIDRQDEEILPEHFKILTKLGIETLMLLYDKNNLEIVQAHFDDKTSGVSIDPDNDPKTFEVWRTRVDELDNQLIETLAKRFQIVSEMGSYKSQHKMPLFEAGRWQEILKSRKEIAQTKNVDEELIGKIFEAIHLSGLKKMLEE